MEIPPAWTIQVLGAVKWNGSSGYGVNVGGEGAISNLNVIFNWYSCLYNLMVMDVRRTAARYCKGSPLNYGMIGFSYGMCFSNINVTVPPLWSNVLYHE